MLVGGLIKRDLVDVLNKHPFLPSIRAYVRGSQLNGPNLISQEENLPFLVFYYFFDGGGFGGFVRIWVSAKFSKKYNSIPMINRNLRPP